ELSQTETTNGHPVETNPCVAPVIVCVRLVSVISVDTYAAIPLPPPPLSAEQVEVPSVLMLRMCPVPVQSFDCTPPLADAPGFGNRAAGRVPAPRSDAEPLVATVASVAGVPKPPAPLLVRACPFVPFVAAAKSVPATASPAEPEITLTIPVPEGAGPAGPVAPVVPVAPCGPTPPLITT